MTDNQTGELLTQRQSQTDCKNQTMPETEASEAAEAAARAIRETEEAIAELGCIYLLELPNELEQMNREIQAAAAKHDSSALRQATNRAHQIKGTAGSLGFVNLSQIATALEKELLTVGKEEFDSENPKWAEIFASLERAKVWIKQKVDELDSD
ncbi:Hpt domain-containing protein [bacterium]|jgi:HPt (histidine-containing phosphotransfer) domain-containing protein|nr:Hpt domain-containing protein [bacterium]